MCEKSDDVIFLGRKRGFYPVEPKYRGIAFSAPEAGHVIEGPKIEYVRRDYSFGREGEFITLGPQLHETAGLASETDGNQPYLGKRQLHPQNLVSYLFVCHVFSPSDFVCL